MKHNQSIISDYVILHIFNATSDTFMQCTSRPSLLDPFSAIITRNVECFYVKNTWFTSLSNPVVEHRLAIAKSRLGNRHEIGEPVPVLISGLFYLCITHTWVRKVITADELPRRCIDSAVRVSLSTLRNATYSNEI